MKIGRNETCPCGSGKKYKRCCAGKKASSEAGGGQKKQEKVTLTGTISVFQEYASQKKEIVQQLGVFLLYADRNGDSWVLEVTDSDCIQIASHGKALDVPIEENDETIIVDWSHTFSFKNKQLCIDAYRKKETLILEQAPSQQLAAAARKILKKVSPELLEQVHLSE